MQVRSQQTELEAERRCYEEQERSHQAELNEARRQAEDIYILRYTEAMSAKRTKMEAPLAKERQQDAVILARAWKAFVDERTVLQERLPSEQHRLEEALQMNDRPATQQQLSVEEAVQPAEREQSQDGSIGFEQDQ